jgi:hypothetical protein
MFDAKKTAEELEKIFFSPAIVSARHTMSSVEKIVCEIYAEGRKQMREAAAKVAESHDAFTGYWGDSPSPENYVDEGTKLYARGNYNARASIARDIRSLPLEPQPLETKGTDNA